MASPGRVSESVSSVRSRKNRQQRIAELLAAAAAIVSEGGPERLTASSLAQRCGVSPQLVYAYFGNLTEVKRQLLHNAFLERRVALNRRLASANDLRDVVAAFVRSDSEEAATGSLIAQLEPLQGVGSVLDELREQDRMVNGPFLFSSVNDAVTLPHRVIELLLNAGSGASLAAAAFVSDAKVDSEAAIEATVEFILAGVAAVDAKSFEF